MMKPYYPDQVDWILYFEPQHGGSRFIGYPYQRGGNLFHFISRIINSPVGKELVQRTAGVVRDIRKGERPIKAIKTHGRQAIKNLTGLGPVIRKRKRRTRQSLFVPALENE